MATYKESVGTAVTNVAGDFPGAADGELWFNSTAATFQYQYESTTDAWSTGGNLNLARGNLAGAGASNTASLAFAGDGPTTDTESYNGSSWTEVNNMNLGRFSLAGCGTQTAALGFGGLNPGSSPSYLNETESWNGTNWTEVNNLNRNVFSLGGAGTQTAALAYQEKKLILLHLLALLTLQT